MSYSVGEESSSSSDAYNSSSKWEYDVFLSFAGKDTRLNFTDHLYDAFIRSGIRCFKDDVDLPRGEDINYLFQAIQDSLCAVLVISQNYAKSTWCLDELQKILESRERLGRKIFPIFYNVNPADLRHQQESFGEALVQLEQKFKEHPTKVRSRRTALSKIGNLSGWVTRDKHEADLIKNMVGDVWRFLSNKLPSFYDNLVGIDSKVADLIPLLEIGLDDKRFVGIWGMGGVGKTTLARVVFDKLSDKFEICCFLEKKKKKEKVKEALPKEGLVSLQKRLLSRLQIKKLKIYDSVEGIRTIRKLLRDKKVLLILDDIDDMSQLKNLAESPDWFGKGSRIIITTRDSFVLTSYQVERIYEMKTMKNDESLQIFSKNAFNKNHPEEKYLEYSKCLVKYAGGLPLALQTLGSYLRGRNEEAVWRDALDKLTQINSQINPHKKILQVLKISYDGLDEKEQTIFLDIVCLFKHWEKEEVTQILKGCDLNPILGIKVLIEKTLLVETEDGRLDMHDLYEELGLDIIRQNSPHSRMRKYGEIKEVLENNKGSGEIEAIVMKETHWLVRNEIVVHPKAFSNMSRLRLLFLDWSPNVPKGLEKLPGALKFVRWPSFPFEALSLPLDEFVHIEMQDGNIKQLGNGKKSINHLKFINLRGSHKFTETPDFSNVQSLEHLNLARCTSLVKVHESLGVLKELVEVDLHGCENLNSLPSKLETNSLRKLDLCWCKKVKKLPEFGEGMKKLSYLDVSRTTITRLPELLGSLIGLRYLDASHTAISRLPESLGSLTGLRYLDASHTNITKLPESLGSLTGLRYLCLRETHIINLPNDCFSGLFELVFLSLARCARLKLLPRLPPRLIRLEADGCVSMICSFDEHWLNLVTSLDHEFRGQTKYVISDEEAEIMPFPYEKDDFSLLELKDVEPEYHPFRNFFAIMSSGGMIPSWFYPNIEYYEKDRCECQIRVEVPPNFRSSKWSGIVVCLHIKGRAGFISWRSKAPGDQYKRWPKWSYCIRSLYGGDGLCIMVLEFNQKNCWRHLRGDNNSLYIQLSFSGFNVLGNNFRDILGCGWRVMCKEDIQKWCKPDHFNQHAPPSEIKLPLGLLGRVLGR